MTTSGIYRILNRVNGKLYVGSAVEIENRWKTHLACLRGKYHINKHLENAWLKYGEEAFLFEIIEKCPCENFVILFKGNFGRYVRNAKLN